MDDENTQTNAGGDTLASAAILRKKSEVDCEVVGDACSDFPWSVTKKEEDRSGEDQ